MPCKSVEVMIGVFALLKSTCAEFDCSDCFLVSIALSGVYPETVGCFENLNTNKIIKLIFFIKI